MVQADMIGESCQSSEEARDGGTWLTWGPLNAGYRKPGEPLQLARPDLIGLPEAAYLIGEFVFACDLETTRVDFRFSGFERQYLGDLCTGATSRIHHGLSLLRRPSLPFPCCDDELTRAPPYEQPAVRITRALTSRATPAPGFVFPLASPPRRLLTQTLSSPTQVFETNGPILDRK